MSNTKLAAIVGLFVIVVGIAVAASATGKPAVSTATPAGQSTRMGSNTGMMSSFKDGTYSATGTYDNPGGSESVFVTVSLKNNLVTDVTTTTTNNARESRFYRQQFLATYKSQVVGRSLASLQLSSISGSSLTPIGFNNALDQIRSQAKS